MRALSAVLLLSLLAPAAQAGLRIASIDVQDDPLEPELQMTQIIVLGEADCTSVLLRRSPTSTAGIPLRVNGTGDNMLLNGLREILVDPSGCGVDQSTVPVNLTLQAVVRRTAPAMVPQNGTVTWDFEPSPVDGQDPAHAEGAFELRARPVVVPQATFGRLQATVAGEPVVFRAALNNLGNVAFMATGAAALADIRGSPGVTATIDVSSAEVGPATTGEITITVGVPEGTWSSAHVVGKLTFASTIEPAGSPRVVPFDFLLTRLGADRNQVQDLDVPMPMLTPLAGLVVAAWLSRRAGRP